jgi:phosphopantothenoylcysteine decarboxylase/phosphopantothenate--cysteine ligase
VTVIAVETALEMERAVMGAAGSAGVVVMAAAVADFRPKASADIKLKKLDGPPEVVLEPTTDILATLGATRSTDQLLVGFAAETAHGLGREEAAEHLRRYAREKLSSKNADLVVANDVAAPGVGFAHDTNAVLIVGSDGVEIEVPLASKEAVAEAIADAIETRLAAKAGPATAHGGGRDDAESQETP